MSSVEGILILVGSTFFFFRFAERTSNWLRWYFVKHSLAVLDNLPEGIGFNIKTMASELFGKKQGWNSYNPIKGYSSDTLRMWIMFGKYKIFWRKKGRELGHEFNFDITYFGKAWFDENFTRLTGATIPTLEQYTTNRTQPSPVGKQYDLLEKYGFIDGDGKLKTGEKKY